MVNLISSRIVNMSVKHLPPVLNVISWSLWYFHLNCRGEKQEMQKKHNPAMWCMEVNNKLNIKPKWPPAHPHTHTTTYLLWRIQVQLRWRRLLLQGPLFLVLWLPELLLLRPPLLRPGLPLSAHSTSVRTVSILQAFKMPTHKNVWFKKNLLDLKWTVVTVSDWCDQRHRQTMHWSNIDIWYQGDGDANKFGVIMVSI